MGKLEDALESALAGAMDAEDDADDREVIANFLDGIAGLRRHLHEAALDMRKRGIPHDVDCIERSMARVSPAVMKCDTLLRLGKAVEAMHFPAGHKS